MVGGVLGRHAIVTRAMICCSRHAHMWWQLLFYMLPVGMMLGLSLGLGENGWAPAPQAAYATILSEPRYGQALGNSLRLGALSAIAAVAVGLPLAYAVRRFYEARTRRRLLLALAVPFFSSFVLRMYGWQAWVSHSGILAWFGRSLFRTPDASGFLFTEAAALIGLLSILLPVATLVISLGLARLDPTLGAAARNLGASGWAILVRIELPFILPAVLVAFLFCFLVAFGDFVCVTALGGNQIYYFSIAISDQMKINDWALASALGVLMLALSVACMAATFLLIGRTGAAKARANWE